jgi:tRNA nucleotidyltransferase (CCA-adding enzyme)
MARFDPQQVLDALAARPDGAALLALAKRRTAVVGGFVRDVLTAREPREIDIVVEGDPLALARQLGGEVRSHARFLACHLTRDGWSIEITGARRERYPEPGALPLVEPASVEQDLGRRDFTVNALAVTLADGELLAPAGALDDLRERRLRVFHDASFSDDPTRVIRLYRYAHRLGFEIERHTGQLARVARLDTLSGARLGAELRLVLREPDPLAVLGDIADRLPLEVDRALTDVALALAPRDADRDLLILAAAMRHGVPKAWLGSLELTARERAVIERARELDALVAALDAAGSPSAIREVAYGVPVELIALAGALGPAANARSWLQQLRHVQLEIAGSDLLAAGVPQGPEIGVRLERTLRRKLDGELVADRAAELASALEGVA